MIETPCIKLVSMPWTTLTEPSLGLAILKRALSNAGFSCRVHHLNLFLLRHLTHQTYEAIAQTFALNDFVFTGLIDPEPTSKQLNLLRYICDEVYEAKPHVAERFHSVEAFVNTVLTVRQEVVPSYLYWCADQILASSPKLVGFTCMFDQTLASIALAKVIKEISPTTHIVLGGYALEGDPGQQILRSFRWIDSIVRGDGETAIVALARHVHHPNGSGYQTVPGLTTQLMAKAGLSAPTARCPIEHAPTPDYSDFYADLADLHSEDQVAVSVRTLPIESSRGCWWGQKSHCTFCGIDEETMKYREKSAEKVVGELDEISATYAPPSIRFNDYILPRSYFRSLLPQLSTREPKLHLGCELKANTTGDELALLAAAGFRELQPGIESFSTSALRKMKKGVSAIQNIRFLVNSYILGVSVNYNYLSGFPKDTPDDYYPVAETLPRLFHLQPPIDHSGVVLTRFSPLRESPDNYGVPSPISHDCRYELLFSDLTAKELSFDYSRYAYYFEAPFLRSKELENVFCLIQIQISIWKTQHKQRNVYLSDELRSDCVLFRDTRRSETPRECSLGLVARDICLELREHDHRSIASLFEALQSKHSLTGLKDSLDALIDLEIVHREGDSIVLLSVPADVYAECPAQSRASHWIALKGTHIAL